MCAGENEMNRSSQPHAPLRRTSYVTTHERCSEPAWRSTGASGHPFDRFK